MAVELASAYVSIIPSARGMQGNLRRELSGPLEAEGREAGRRTGHSFRTAFTGTLGAIATSVAAKQLFDLGGAGLKVAADFQQTQIAFEGILGNKDAADELIGSLREMANVTPFQFSELTKSTRQLLAVGVAADEVLPIMETLGNQAAALGVGQFEIEGVVRALGQMKGKGKVSAEELRQISEQFPGFSAINAIAADLGVTVAEAFKLVENGAVPANEGIEAILAGMENFPGAAGAMERQSKTLNGVISTFKDTLATTAIDFITPYLPAISSGVASFGGFIGNTADDLKGLLDLFEVEGFGGVFDRLGSLIETNGPVVGAKLQQLGGELVGWISRAGPPAIEALAGWVGDITEWILDPGLGLVGDGVAVLIPALVDWVTDDVIPKLFGVGKGEGAFYDMLAAFAEWVKEDGVPGFIQGGKDLGAGIIEGIIDGLGDAFDIKTSKIKIGPIEIDAPLGIKGLASGGTAFAGEPVVVGEKGPEWFVPRRTGVVYPHGTSLPAVAGGAGAISLTVVQMPGENSVETGMRELRRYQALAS